MSNEIKNTQQQKDFEIVQKGFGTYTEKKRVLKRLSPFEDSDNKADNADNKDDKILKRIELRKRAYAGLPQSEIDKIQEVKLAEDRITQPKEVTSITEKDLEAMALSLKKWTKEQLKDIFDEDTVLVANKTSIDTKNQQIKELKEKSLLRKLKIITT